MNVLGFGDWNRFTGFGNVMQNIMTNMPESWNIKVHGMSYNPSAEMGTTPDNIDIIDAMGGKGNDIFGRERFLKLLAKSSFDYDLVFILQDSFILSMDVPVDGERMPFIEAVYHIADSNDAKVVTYTPMDQPRPYAEWFDLCLEYSHKLVYYLDWARDNIKEYSDKDHSQADVIHHGVDKDTFFPLDKIQRHNIADELGFDTGQFNILFGGANQRRKNIPRDVMSAFVRLHQDVGDRVKLLLKTQPNRGVGNNGEGWNLGKIMKQLIQDYNLPDDCMQFIGSEQGFLPAEKLNHIYNAVDAVYVPSTEGWGMWCTESMSAKTPTITANHASLGEIGGEGRSVQVKTKNSLENRVWFTDDWSIYRSVVDTDDFVEQTKGLMNMQSDTKQHLVDTAYESDYCREWSEIVDEWQTLFEEVV